MAAPKSFGSVSPKSAAQSLTSGQHGARHAQQLQQFIVPLASADIEEKRARCVGRIGGVHLAAGQAPDKEAVDRTEAQRAGFGLRARAFDGIENPGAFRPGEIGIEQQARARSDQRLLPRALQFRANIGGAAILPDDRLVDRLAGLAIPDERRFALIGDADRDDIARRRLGLPQARHAWCRARVAQISSGSCSTQPDFGKYCLNSRCAVATGLSFGVNRIDRVEVVPWSIARMYFDMKNPRPVARARIAA